MPEENQQEQQTTETQTGTEQTSQQAKSLEELLAGLPDDQRNVILGEVTKARGEAKNLRERLKAAEPKVAEFEKLTEAQKTEQQKALDALNAAEQKAAAAEQQLLRFQVAAEKKLDPDLVQFLNGTSKEDIEAQAEALLAKVNEKRAATNLGQGVRSGAGQAPDMNSLLRSAAGRN